ncbi:MAG: PhoH family protein [Coriobacteriaceae bacterium]|nr:PhoH family protein [Coriobacteriaceae bacterium]
MSSDYASVKMSVPVNIDPVRVLGPADSLLRVLISRFDAKIVARGGDMQIMGDVSEVESITAILSRIITAVRCGETLMPDDVDRMVDELLGSELSSGSVRNDVLISHRSKVIRPKTAGQQRYVDAIREHTVTFCLGPAGTGKTYLAMAMAVGALERHEVGRIVLTRPVVEAGENLGFLPGTLEEKVDPYVRPLYDALFDMMDAERVQELVQRGVIEIAPLAYMRGRTLNDAFVILDEAQNTTPEQMKMFLTRLGNSSTFVVTGDATQRDLGGKRGGLDGIEEILGGVEGIAFAHLARTDVVRHRLVGKIVAAYEAADANKERSGHGRAHK